MESKRAKRAATGKKPKRSQKKSRSRIQIRDKLGKVLWGEWVNKERRKIGLPEYPPQKFHDYLFANAVKAAQCTHEEFMTAKLRYQQKYGWQAFLTLLKKHNLHTGQVNRLGIVEDLLKVIKKPVVNHERKGDVMVNHEKKHRKTQKFIQSEKCHKMNPCAPEKNYDVAHSCQKSHFGMIFEDF